VARWQARRREALAAVAAGLEDGSLARADRRADDAAGALAPLLHKLAGTAAMFGEPALGIAAAALERALVTGEDAKVCIALATSLLTEAEAEGHAANEVSTAPQG
jgi:HPt (histidine-containing phosphotransfer) domain-containing protein